jgi:hypothetical protein
MKQASFAIQSFKIVFVGLQRKKSGELWWSDGQLAEVEDGFWANQSPILSSGWCLFGLVWFVVFNTT